MLDMLRILCKLLVKMAMTNACTGILEKLMLDLPGARVPGLSGGLIIPRVWG